MLTPRSCGVKCMPSLCFQARELSRQLAAVDALMSSAVLGIMAPGDDPVNIVTEIVSMQVRNSTDFCSIPR